MQPDLLSAQREEQLEPTTPLVETVKTQPARPVEQKRSRLNFAAIGLALLVLVLFVAFGWVGYWAYTLNAELTATQGQLAALQAKHDQLQADYTTLTTEKEKLNTDLAQSKTALETANTDLATTKADLDKSKDQNKSLTAQIDTASSLAEILYVMAMSDSETDILKVDRLITEAGNKELTKQWDTLTTAPSEDAFNSFFDYLIFATRESLR